MTRPKTNNRINGIATIAAYIPMRMRSTDPGTVGDASRVGIVFRTASRVPLPFLTGDEDCVVSQDSVGPVLLGASRDSVTDVARGGVLESGVKLLAWEGKRNVWGGGVDIDGSGGKLVTDRRSLRGGGGTAAVVVHAFTTWTIGSPYGPVAGVKVMLHVSVIGPASVTVIRVVCVMNDCARGFPST
jgi:hypothetical protein